MVRLTKMLDTCSLMLVRHRHCSFTQRSQRYCSEDGFGYITPDSMRDMSVDLAMARIEGWYQGCQSYGAPNEDARYLLPNACETSLYLSCNLRELIHMCNERLCKRAQWEIRDLVKRMVSLVDTELQFMLVPKCKSGRIICHTKCGDKT